MVVRDVLAGAHSWNDSQAAHMGPAAHAGQNVPSSGNIKVLHGWHLTKGRRMRFGGTGIVQLLAGVKAEGFTSGILLAAWVAVLVVVV